MPRPLTIKELENVIKESKEELKRIKLYSDDRAKEVMIGLVMNKVRIGVEGKFVAGKI